MEAQRSRSAVVGVVLGLLATGVVAVSLETSDASAVAAGGKKSDPVTARQIVDRIKGRVTCPWRERTVDTFKAGDPDAPWVAAAADWMRRPFRKVPLRLPRSISPYASLLGSIRTIASIHSPTPLSIDAYELASPRFIEPQYPTRSSTTTIFR